MVVFKKEHKAILFDLFVEETNQMGQKSYQQRRFNLEDLADAGSALRKLQDSVNETKTSFLDGDLDFTLGEIIVLKKLFDTQKEWTAEKAEFVFEIKALFDGKEQKTPSAK
jgi:hypothetical protein